MPDRLTPTGVLASIPTKQEDKTQADIERGKKKAMTVETGFKLRKEINCLSAYNQTISCFSLVHLVIDVTFCCSISYEVAEDSETNEQDIFVLPDLGDLQVRTP